MRRPAPRTIATAAAWCAAGAIGATALTGIAVAATDPPVVPSPPTGSLATGDAPAPGTGNGMGMGPGMGMGMGPGQGMGMDADDRMGAKPGPIVHGDVVVADGNGGYRTVRIQQGVITERSATSVTVRSDDGYVSSWTIASSSVLRRDRSNATAEQLVVGDRALVRGPVADGTATVAMLRSFSPQAWEQRQQRMDDRREKRQERREQRQERRQGTPPQQQGGTGS